MLAIEKFAAADIAFQGHSKSLQTTLFSTEHVSINVHCSLAVTVCHYCTHGAPLPRYSDFFVELWFLYAICV